MQQIKFYLSDLCHQQTWLDLFVEWDIGFSEIGFVW